MHYYTDALKQYAVFSGRTNRKPFWMFVLLNFLVSVAISIVANIIFSTEVAQIVSWLYALAILLPSLGIAARRLHDIGKSAWWLLIGLIPLVGAIVLIVFYCLDSQPETNAYGPNPKGVATV